jgi:hypothetical protein
MKPMLPPVGAGAPLHRGRGLRQFVRRDALRAA